MLSRIIIKPNCYRIFGLIIFLILTHGAMPNVVQAARGGLPGTGDADFNPAGDTEMNSCFNRNGEDINAFLDISEQIIARSPACRTVNSGEFYIPYSVWITNTAEGFPDAPTVYPEGYAPADPEPIYDFLSKVIVRVTVDNAKVYQFAGEDIAKITAFSELDPAANPAEAPAANLIPKLHPVSVGNHVMRIEWILSAAHCDGFGSVEEVNCLAAGTHLADPLSGARTFSVEAGANR